MAASLPQNSLFSVLDSGISLGNKINIRNAEMDFAV